VDASWAVKHHIAEVHADDLRDSRPSVVEHGQQEMVALRCPGTARLPHHREHLLARQEAEHGTLEALHRHAQRALDEVERGYVTARGELQERTQCR
jgi:hypothetical protein